MRKEKYLDFVSRSLVWVDGCLIVSCIKKEGIGKEKKMSSV